MVRKLVADLARGLAHDLISGVRDGAAWAVFYGINLELRRHHRARARLASSPSWDEVCERANERHAELVAHGRL